MSAKYPVVAFLQNAWFKPETPGEVLWNYTRSVTFRRTVLKSTMTGKRLMIAYGEHFDRIWWDNCSQDIANHPTGCYAANADHMMNVIGTVHPAGLVAYGNEALAGLQQIANREGAKPNWHFCPHPNKRGILQQQLNDFAKIIIARYF